MKPFLKRLKLIIARIDHFFNIVNNAILKFFRKHYLWLVFIVILVASLIVRIAFFPFLSGDMYHFLLSWFNHLRNGGGLKAMGTYPWTGNDLVRAGDYPVSYINILALLSYLPGKPMNIIKALSVFFDYVLAFGALLIVREFNKNKFFSLMAFSVFVFFPTSILNSAIWGQADQIYVAFIVWTLWLLIRKRPMLAMIPLGLALSIKPQAIFFVPVVIFMWLAKSIKLRHLLLIPLTIFATFLPSYFVGAPFKMPFEMYANQITNLYPNANYGAGSLYAFFEMSHFRDGINNYAGVTFAFIAVGIALLYLYHYEVAATPKNLVYVATLFALVVPFVLPHMHERYFYMADALVLVYVLVYRRKYFLGLLMSFSSVLTYTHFLTGQYIFKFLGSDSVRLAALINASIIITLFFEAKHVLEKVPGSITDTIVENAEEIS